MIRLTNIAFNCESPDISSINNLVAMIRRHQDYKKTPYKSTAQDVTVEELTIGESLGNVVQDKSLDPRIKRPHLNYGNSILDRGTSSVVYAKNTLTLEYSQDTGLDGILAELDKMHIAPTGFLREVDTMIGLGSFNFHDCHARYSLSLVLDQIDKGIISGYLDIDYFANGHFDNQHHVNYSRISIEMTKADDYGTVKASEMIRYMQSFMLHQQLKEA